MAGREALAAIGGRVEAIYGRIDAACQRCGRDPRSVKLLFATKTRGFDEVLEAARHAREEPCVIGENQVQTAVERVADGIHKHNFDKHFIGTLQSNKINQILTFADCIQTVHSMGLAEKLFARLERGDKTIRIFVQVNTSREEQKSGCMPEEAVAMVSEIAERFGTRLKVEGLMTIGVNADTEEPIRECFRTLNGLQEEINALNLPNGAKIEELSMGMTNDLELAIEHGSTIVRIGTAIFGERNYAKKPSEIKQDDAAPTSQSA